MRLISHAIASTVAISVTRNAVASPPQDPPESAALRRATPVHSPAAEKGNTESVNGVMMGLRMNTRQQAISQCDINAIPPWIFKMPNRPAPPRPKTLEKRDYEHLSQFRYRLRLFLRASETICKRHGLTMLQYQLLLHVMGFTGRTWASIGELAERLQAQHHGVVALVDRCERLRLLKRQPGRDDQRVVEVHLLPQGEKLLAKIAALHQEERRSLFCELAAVDAPGDETP